MYLHSKPELPFLVIRLLGSGNHELELCVGFLPVLHGEYKQVIRRFAVSHRELEEPIFGFWTERDEFWKTLDVHILTHKLALRLRTINYSSKHRELEGFAFGIVKLSSQRV